MDNSWTKPKSENKQKKSTYNGAGLGALVVLGRALVVLGLVGFLAYSHFNKPSSMPGWSLTYLDSANMPTVAGMYPTRAECAQKLDLAKSRGYDRPECGSNCHLDEKFFIFVCDETFEL